MNPASVQLARGISAAFRQSMTRRLAGASFIALSAFSVPESRASVVTGFETSNGSYANGSTVIGVNDTTFGGAWASFGTGGSVTASNASPDSGLLALRINDSSTSQATGAVVNIANASAILGQEFTFKFSLNIQSISAATGSQVQVYFGQNLVGDGNHWLRFVYNDGNLQVVTGNGNAGSDTAVNVGAYTTYSPLGSYIDVSLSLDPATHKYTGVSIAGTLTSANLTSTVLASNGGTIPWTSSAGNPSAFLNLLIASNDTGVVDFDSVGVSAIPEPSSFAAIAAVGVLGAAAMRRRRNR